MRRLAAFFLAACLTLLCFAIPAKRIATQLSQPDGSIITAYLCGDEHFHFYIDADGDMLTTDSKGFYVKATTEQVAESKARWREKIAKRNEARARRTDARKVNARKAFGQKDLLIGSKKGLVILVNFDDKAMKSVNTRTAFDNQFNQKGYNKNYHSGSVHDYFYDQSYEQFDLTFDVIGPVTLSREMAYYGQNDRNGDDLRAATMIIEACKLVNQQVNFKDYDWDGDGEVEQVYVIYAGYGEHAGAGTNCIWPHEFSLTEAMEFQDGNGPIVLDGVRIDTYATSCELRGKSGYTMDGIGTACHEFSHCIGLPDLYDTDYSGGFGMSYWDIMDSGSYNGRTGYGESPCGFTAYEREFAGWMEITELDEPCSIKEMPYLQGTPVAYKVYNDGNRNEYFVLENRQSTKWFENIVGGDGRLLEEPHGLMIYHVDYNEKAWKENATNDDADHQRLSIVPADGNYGTYSSLYNAYYPTRAQLMGDLFPGSMSVKDFTNTSHTSVGGKLFNRNTDKTYNLNKPITNIFESVFGEICFDFMGGSESPNATERLSIEESENEYFTVNGLRISQPTTSGTYIIKNNNKTKKVFIK